jgi:hypothetical protein
LPAVRRFAPVDFLFFEAGTRPSPVSGIGLLHALAICESGFLCDYEFIAITNRESGAGVMRVTPDKICLVPKYIQ